MREKQIFFKRTLDKPYISLLLEDFISFTILEISSQDNGFHLKLLVVRGARPSRSSADELLGVMFCLTSFTVSTKKSENVSGEMSGVDEVVGLLAAAIMDHAALQGFDAELIKVSLALSFAFFSSLLYMFLSLIQQDCRHFNVHLAAKFININNDEPDTLP
ncbi:hypothetical protein J6590_059038 [Homalodisca vitripennis]|nr:hypothetical protein J6590_059038 [Homalodisca vitripennis]